VDDDAPLRRALVRILRPCDVVPVTCAAEALRALSEGTFDAILTDYGIEPTDGVRLLGETARAHPSPRRYLMSGFDESRFDEHVASGLIHKVFPKPLDLGLLRAELRCDEPSRSPPRS
jgi:DNA-binding NtrC family response regulator